jgi:hypothetical protein
VTIAGHTVTVNRLLGEGRSIRAAFCPCDAASCSSGSPSRSLSPFPGGFAKVLLATDYTGTPYVIKWIQAQVSVCLCCARLAWDCSYGGPALTASLAIVPNFNRARRSLTSCGKRWTCVVDYDIRTSLQFMALHRGHSCTAPVSRSAC